MYREYKNNMRERAWNLTSVLFNRPHSIHKCSNMAPSFSGKNKFFLKAFFLFCVLINSRCALYSQERNRLDLLDLNNIQSIIILIILSFG